MKKINPILLQNYESFYEWEKAVESLDNTTEKGDAMELFTFFYLSQKKEYFKINEIYMEDEIPESIRKNLRLELKDNGVDGIIINNDQESIAYQVKFRSNRAIPTARELSTFWSESEYADHRLIIANCSKLPKVTDKKKNQMSILIDSFIQLPKDFFTDFVIFLQTKKINTTPSLIKYTPLPYQDKLINDILLGFNNYDRGKLIAACGIGKTLIGMWLHERLEAKTILFVVPSLALIKQTLDSWTKHANVPFDYLCVCSDITVANNDNDDIVTNVASMDFPVTTDPTVIRTFLNKKNDKKIVFSTYNSLDAVSNSLNDTELVFDLGIFDESHRTAGTKDSLMFLYGMDNRYIPINKRLFMTATERLVSHRIKSKLKNNDNVIFSMDDESKYGPTFASLNFGEAIKQNIINDYKIVLTTISEKDVSDLFKSNNIIKTELGENSSETDITTLLKQVLIAKVVEELNVKKIISYHSYVKNASIFVNGNSYIHPIADIIENLSPSTKTIYTNHVNGTMTAGERKEILATFEQSEKGLISNAKCLTEGIDVPAIDAVYFVDPKNSMIDIVQAVGRALRKSNSKESDCSYIIIPIVIPDNVSSFENLEPSIFSTLHNVIQSMRSQDSSLADIIDELNFSVARGSLGTKKSRLDEKILTIPYSNININDFEEALSLRVAEINKNPTDSLSDITWTEQQKESRKSSLKRVFVSLGDYTLDSYLNSLILPTLDKFTNENDILTSSNLKINHNNVSHTARIGMIHKDGQNYQLTHLGKKIRNSVSDYEIIVQEQLLKYYSLNKETKEVLFPYRAILKIFLEFNYITRFEFLYCIYPLRSTSNEAIQDTISRINYLRETYSNIDILNETNKQKVLDLLNAKYDLSFSFKDIWTSRTTAYNQFNYFKKHLLDGFKSIFNSNNKDSKNKIILNDNSQQVIQDLLDSTKKVELAASEKNFTLLLELFENQIL